MNYDAMSREDLIAMIEALRNDRSFDILKKESAIVEWDVKLGDQIIFIDLANMHALNHKYTMDGADSLIRNVTAWMRQSDNVAKFGGDEIVVWLQKDTNAWQYMNRLASKLEENDLYAVIATTKAVKGDKPTILESTVTKLDTIVTAEKKELDMLGEKSNRIDAYVRKDTIIVAV